jgi:hypothetical protein
MASDTQPIAALAKFPPGYGKPQELLIQAVAAGPQATLHLPDPRRAVIVEGVVQEIEPSQDVVDRLIERSYENGSPRRRLDCTSVLEQAPTIGTRSFDERGVQFVELGDHSFADDSRPLIGREPLELRSGPDPVVSHGVKVDRERLLVGDVASATTCRGAPQSGLPGLSWSRVAGL